MSTIIPIPLRALIVHQWYWIMDGMDGMHSTSFPPFAKPDGVKSTKNCVAQDFCHKEATW
jgi:hypothetical protein